jgi:hypothetical protein
MSAEVFELAAKEILDHGRKYREVAEAFGICFVSLYKYVSNIKKGIKPNVGYKQPRLIFTPEQETTLSDYLIKCSSVYFGLLPDEVKKLAYEAATHLGIENLPPNWHKNKMAGDDWFTAFMKRNPNLSIRSPEATSLSRATSFNRTNVHEFFEKYRDVLERFKLSASRIWNVDETGVTTVQKPKKVVAQRGLKQVGAVTSAERGTLVTLAAAANAIGNFIPCMFVFPRIRYNDIFVSNGPPECIGAGNSSGWMSKREFLIFLDHFIKHTKPTSEDPVLLFLDNHHSHVNIEVVNKAKENNIILLSFPPHCSHNLQPLDVGVYGPFKNYVNRQQTNWMSSNPGKTMTIYNIPGIVKEAFPLAFTQNNIINSFRKAGIWPCNEDVFQDVDFAPSFVTDRPITTLQNNLNQSEQSLTTDNRENTSSSEVPDMARTNPSHTLTDSRLVAPNQTSSQINTQTPSQSPNITTPTPEIQDPFDSRKQNNPTVSREQNNPTVSREQPSTSNHPTDLVDQTSVTSLSFNIDPSLLPEIDSEIGDIDVSITEVIDQMSQEPIAGPSTANDAYFDVEAFRPLPKAGPRVSQHKRKRTKKCAILTDTPEKQALEDEYNQRDKKKQKTIPKAKNSTNSKNKNKGKGIGKSTWNKQVKNVKKKILQDSDSEDDDWYCLACGGSYSSDTSGVDWFECRSCKKWAHGKCIKGNPYSFMCLNCNSDDDYDDD